MSPTPVFSIVVPTRQNRSTLPALVTSIRLQPSPPTELVVVDGDSTDGTIEYAAAEGATVIRVPADRTVKRNAGARAASGSYLMFIDSDMELEPGLLGRAEVAMRDRDALCLEERIPLGSYWARARDFERRCEFGSGVYEAARVFRRELFEELGGYDPQLVGLEDIDLQARLLARKARVGWLDRALIHHEESVGLTAYLSKKRGRSPRNFAQKNSSLWRTMTSPIGRGRLVVAGLRRDPSVENLTLMPGLVLMRSAEYAVRWLQ